MYVHKYFAQMYTKIFENSEGGYQPMIHEQSTWRILLIYAQLIYSAFIENRYS